jgi:hypothetical protein
MFWVLLLIACVAIFLLWSRKQPTGRGPWTPEHAEPAYAEIEGEHVTIRHVRDFEFRALDDYTARYYDKAIDLSDVVSVDLGLTTLVNYSFASHTFVSFGLRDGTHLVVSVEARRRPGTAFSPLRGLFRNYELIYVVADERDFIPLCVQAKKLDLYLYPVVTTPEKAQRAFVSMLRRANALRERPEFYNTLTNSCTVNLVRHVNITAPGRIPWSIRLPLSFGIDELAHRAGILHTPLSFPEARAAHRVTAGVADAPRDAGYSRRIRDAMRFTALVY